MKNQLIKVSLNFIFIAFLLFTPSAFLHSQTTKQELKSELVAAKSAGDQLKIIDQIIELESDQDTLIALSRKCLDIAIKDDDKNQIVTYYLKLADVLMSEGKWKESLDQITAAENIKNTSSLSKEKIIDFKGAYYLQLREPNKSDSIYQLNTHKNTSTFYKAQAHKALIDVNAIMGKTELAVENGLIAKSIMTQNGYNVQLLALNINLAKLYNYLREFDKAVELLIDAEKIAKAGSKELSQIYAELGVAYKNSYRLDESIIFYEKALKILETMPSKYALRASTATRLSDVYFKTNQFQKQFKLLSIAEKNADAINSQYWRTYIYYQKGLYYKTFKPIDSAKYYFEKALSISNISKDNEMIAVTKSELGHIYSLQGDRENAENYLLESIEYSNKGLSIKILNNTYLYLSEHFERAKEFEKAFFYHKKHKVTADSMSAVANNEKLKELQIKYKTTENENKIEVLAQEAIFKERELTNTKQTYIILGLLLVAVSTLGFFYLSTKRKQKEVLLKRDIKYKTELILSKNRIVENLSHEIRTPLSVINGYLELIKKNHVYPKNILKYSDKAIDSGDHLIENLNNFLTLLRLDKDIQDIEQTDFFRSEIEKSIYRFVGPTFQKGQKLYYKTNISEKLHLSYKYDSIDKIISNLISNAIKYSRSGKSIFVCCMINDKDMLEITVKDEGVGIPLLEKNLIFNRFYQSKAHNISGGFGIGLDLINKLIKNLGGEISVISEENIGSEFKVLLPLEIKDLSFYIEPFIPNYKLINDIVTEVEEISKADLPKIIVVDDHLDMVSFLKELLKDNFIVDTAYDGLQGLNKIRDYPDYELIISDMRMPIMDGLELKAALNKNDELAGIPFILLTASNFGDIADLKLQHGLNDFIPKPFEQNEILTRIKRLLKNKLHQKSAIEPSSHTATYDGHVSELLDKLNRTVHKNIANSEYTIGDLASEIGYSQKQLGKIIKENTGLTIVKLILEIRLLKAYEMISNNTYPTLMEVIYAVGLTNRSYFNKKFIARFGMKPTDLSKGRISK